MATYLLILRVIHILTGVFWAGGVFSLAMFIIPATNNTQPEGGKVMQKMMFSYKFPQWMTIISILNILSGIFLLERLSFGFQLEWIKTPHGLVLTIGGVIAILAFLHGISSNRPKAMRMGKLAQTIGQRGGPPTEAEAAEIIRLRKSLTTGTNIVAIMLLLTVLCMSMAKYIN